MSIKKIHYEIEATNSYLGSSLITPCSIYKDKLVGSVACSCCEFYVPAHGNVRDRYIYCRYNYATNLIFKKSFVRL